MKERIIIIDGNSLVNRAFYAMPPLTNKEGVNTNAVYGFVNMLYKVLDDYKPDYLSVAFDLKGPTFRHVQYNDYKGKRKGMPEELAEQMPILKEMLDVMKIHRMELSGFEADDLIGTVAHLCSNEGMEVFIITGDKDALQLVNDNTRVLMTKKGISQIVPYDENMVLEEYGVSPAQITDFKGLSGDSSDNIPGIPKVGPKTATKLLQEFHTVEELIERSEEISNKRIKGLVQEYQDQAMMSKNLATIECQVPIEFDINDYKMGTPDKDELLEIFVRYNFKNFIKKLSAETSEHGESVASNNGTAPSHDVTVVTPESHEAVLAEIKAAGQVTYAFVYDKLTSVEVLFQALALTMDGEKIYYVDLTDVEQHKPLLKGIFEDPGIRKISYEGKQDILALMANGIKMEGLAFDCFVALYLIDPSRKEYDMSEVAMEFLQLAIKGKVDIVGKGAKEKRFSEIDRDTLLKYISDYTAALYKLYDTFSAQLKELELETLYSEVELPLIEILASIEHEGFNVDTKELELLDGELTAKLTELTDEIYRFSGEPFNINSPKQLGVVLFEKLELPVIKKTKTGYSTSHDVLEKLNGQHPIIGLIMEYRTYSKLKSTYIDGLFSVINEKTKRIHTSLNQTVTVTGRLSSTDPNLQNIPVRLPLGRRIRKVFVPTEGNILLDADYSQIELRILAHLSEDENLLRAFNEDIDVHALTASQVFGVEIDKVTSLERSRAKEVNFGIVYGMSDFGLSENLNITRKEAKAYIDNYFAKYPKVKDYMDQQIQDCRDNGYVTTILNRRRYIPEINQKNFNLRSFAERTAMNTPIQGSAADIIKIAMIRVYEALKRQNLKSKLILQVHDELIIDTYPDEVDVVKDLLVEEMEKAYELNVPLKVDMNAGNSWYDSK